MAINEGIGEEIQRKENTLSRILFNLYGFKLEWHVVCSYSTSFFVIA